MFAYVLQKNARRPSPFTSRDANGYQQPRAGRTGDTTTSGTAGSSPAPKAPFTAPGETAPSDQAGCAEGPR